MIVRSTFGAGGGGGGGGGGFGAGGGGGGGGFGAGGGGGGGGFGAGGGGGGGGFGAGGGGGGGGFGAGGGGGGGGGFGGSGASGVSKYASPPQSKAPPKTPAGIALPSLSGWPLLWFTHPDTFPPMTPQVAAAIAAAVWRSVQPVQLFVAAQLLRKRARIIQIHNLCLFIKSPSLTKGLHATQPNIYMISKIIKIGENPVFELRFPLPEGARLPANQSANALADLLAETAHGFAERSH
jgi:hypothetical protein